MVGGRWWVAGGEWQVVGGGWQVAGGRWSSSACKVAARSALSAARSRDAAARSRSLCRSEGRMATASSCTRSALSHSVMHSSCTRTEALALCRCSRRLATSSPSSVVLTAVAERRSTFSDSFRSPSVRSSFVSSVGAGAAGGLAERRRPPARTEPVDNAGALP